MGVWRGPRGEEFRALCTRLMGIVMSQDKWIGMFVAAAEIIHRDERQEAEMFLEPGRPL